MTKAMLNIDPLNKSIMFDCSNHADDHDACTIMSTLSNVLVESCLRAGVYPTDYDSGHVRIDIEYADDKTIDTFETVFDVMKQAADQQPDHIRIY